MALSTRERRCVVEMIRGGLPKRVSLLPVFVGLLLAVATAQAQVAALRIDEPSPTAASLGKFGDVPVSLYTGTPSIRVPLHTVRGRTLRVPIALSYHASGVKVEAIPGWVGMGWALNAGGVITRTVRGLPDDGTHGFINTGGDIPGAVWQSVDNPSVRAMLQGGSVSQTLSDYVADVNGQFADPEPDQFFFNVGGRSGQFFFTNDGSIRVAPHQKIKMVPDPTQTLSPPSQATNFTGIPGWTITTEDGTTYRFGQLGSETAREYTVAFGNCTQCASVSSWYLLEITSATGDESITFSYTLSTLITHDRKSYKESFVGIAACPSAGDGPVTTVLNAENVDTIRLEAIVSDFETVTFVSSLRNDAVYMTPDEFKLDRLEIVNGVNNPIRSFDFTYSPRAGSRLFLDRVQEYGSNGASLPAYGFEYGSGTLPNRQSTDDVDHWGYYNAAGNSDPIPELYFEDTPGAVYFNGADKEPTSDPTILNRGVLTRITYPTGGFTEFIFEPHEYGHFAMAPVGYAWSPRQQAEVGAPAGADQTIDFAITQSHGSSDVPISIQIRWDLDANHPPNNQCFDEGSPYNFCVYARLLDAAGAEEAVFWDAPDAPGGITTHPLTLEPGTYTLHVRSVEETLNSGITATASWRIKIAANERSAGGVRIRQIRSDDGMGHPVTKTYIYDLPQAQQSRSSGVLTFEPSYFYVQEFFLAQGLCKQLHRSVRSVAGLGLTQGSPIGYERVTVLNGADSTQGYTVHRFTTANFPEHADIDNEDPLEHELMWSFAARTSRDFKRGRALFSEQFNDTGHSVQRSDKVYFDADVETAPPGDTYRRAQAIAFKGAPPPGVPAAHDFYFKRYEVLSSWSYVDTETIETYGAPMLTRAYEYDADHLQLTHLTETDSNGRQRITDYEYAHERHQTNMAATNMLAQVYSQTVSDDNGDVAKQWTTWRLDNGHWRADEVHVWIGDDGSAPPDPVGSETLRQTTYADYDHFGRITQQQDALGRTVTFAYDWPGNAPNDLLLSQVSQGTLSVQYSYHSTGHKWGLLHQTLDENGDATTYDYDSFQRLASVTTPLGGAATYAYQQQTIPHSLTTTTALDASTSVVTKAFLDGLGRPIQTQRKEDPTTYIVSAAEYDALGRPWKTWKPYRHSTGGVYQDLGAVQDGAETEYDSPGCVATPYVETRYRPDPLGRVDETIPPHCNGTAIPITTRYGAEGGNTFVLTTDEEGNQVNVFTDAFGNQVRTEAGVDEPEATTTAWVYDILGNPLEVHPPNYFTSPSGNARWITTYTYDPRNLLIEKSTPDTDADFHYAYDAAGNLRAVEDPNRSSSGFLYTNYDDYDRITETGLCSTPFPGNPDQQDGCLSGTKSEQVTYTYDTYAGLNPSPPGVDTTNAKGHVTEVDFEGGSYQYVYDDERRVVAFYARLDGLGSKLIDYDYDFQGNVTKVSYQADSLDALYHWYSYDEAGRLKGVKTNELDDEAGAVHEAAYTYRPTGQVAQLRLGADQAAIPPIAYTYHIRDWLTQINDPESLGGNQFAMRLGYDEPAFPGAPTFANGNIGSVVWAGTNSNGDPRVLGYDPGGIPLYQAGYEFTYDALNRLLGADAKLPGGAIWEDDPDYHVPLIEYDPNGNITRLQRNYGAGNTPHDLGYGYGSGNRLLSVSGLPGETQPVTFEYDANGNETVGRGIDALEYDRRNLPMLMTLGSDSLVFRYDADGQRIYKRLDQGGGSIETYYVRGVDGRVRGVYIDDGSGARLQYWNIHSGGAVLGRIVPPSSGTN